MIIRTPVRRSAAPFRLSVILGRLSVIPGRTALLLSSCLALALAACSQETPVGAGSIDSPAAGNQSSFTDSSPEASRPNIVLILADDLGYADLGSFGSEIPTPNLDTLAHEGMMLTDFHTNMTCSPTRAMLMSGTDSHLAGLGVMNGPTREDHIGQPGYEGYLNFRVASLADLLTDAGYNTYMTGKWHLGETVETGPAARGFKRSFVSLSGAAHLGGLSWNGPGLAPYRDGEELVTVDEDFYSTAFYTERMIDYIDADRQDGRPFFAYLAYTAPHWPLQAPEESIARFRGRYDEGYEVLYERRYRNMQRLGLISDESPMEGPDLWTRRWHELSEEEQRNEARKMEIYAAMINDMDHYVGEFLAYLESIGELDNTFIVFLSDNGAEGLRRDLTPMLQDWVAECCDNSYDNLGKGDSYIMYGPDWATASTVALRNHKTTAFEGGIRVPAFVWYPEMVAAGQQSDAFGTIMDLLPTFLDLAGTTHPGSEYRGREVLPVRGQSMLPLLTGEQAQIHTDDTYTGWELYGARGIRQGRWKIVWDAAEGEAARWRLFDVDADPAEREDLSTDFPDELRRMVRLWDRYAEESGVIY